MAENQVVLTRKILQKVIAFLKDSPWKNEYLPTVEHLDTHLEDQCVLAIGGRVKAGKSSLINALLSEDLAKVGITATTATINEFHYRSTEDLKHLPGNIECVYSSGHSEWVDREFLDSLQGQDSETLKKSRGIECLKYYLDNDILREMILVDTPGTEALVAEHTEAVENFFGMEKQVENSKARVCAADAVLYAFENVATSTAADFIEHFNQVTGGLQRIIGVMTQVDLTDDRLANRSEIAKNIHRDLKDSIYTVVPVSAGIMRMLQKTEDSDILVKLHAMLQKLTPQELGKLLLSENSWLCRPMESLPAEEREGIYQQFSCPWRVFAVTAQTLSQNSVTHAKEQLTEIAGIARLKKIIQEHLFARKRLFRYYSAITRILAILYEILNLRIMELKEKVDNDREKMIRFCRFIAEHPQPNSPAADELKHFLSQYVCTENVEEWEKKIRKVILEVERSRIELEKFNLQIEVLDHMEKLKSQLSDFEIQEIINIAELYGTASDPDFSRQMEWLSIAGDVYEPDDMRTLAQLMVRLYGSLQS
ncbi:MAG: dynamin family protein [Thermoguttaceae bacterium]|nr:hypothetical protein [Planctomycetaceae bacterium]MBQ4142203.1 dynamin family protein [Thermoguttaceae bacterium]